MPSYLAAGLEVARAMSRYLPRFLLASIILGGIVLAWVFRDYLNTDTLQAWLTGAGIAAPVVFMALYAIGTVLFLPGSLLTLIGGALFGPVFGTLYNVTGATLGATLAFLVARYAASDWVRRTSGPRLKQVIHGVELQGWRFVAFARLVPLFPFNLLNYALGLTRIRLPDYVVTSYLCMLPGGFAYTYLGYAGREAVTGGEALVHKALLALALLAAAVLVPQMVLRWRRGPALTVEELKDHLDAGTLLKVLDVRSEREFDGELGHIAQAINIPVETLGRRLAELGDDLSQPIAIVCHTERRSHQAARLLRRKGFSRTCVVQGGMARWSAAEFPVVR